MRRMPTSYAIVMYREALDRGVDLLADLPVGPHELESSEFMSLDHYLELLARYTALQDDPDWGFRLGDQFSMSAHGPVGFGAISAPTVRDGLIFLARYMPTRASYAQTSIELRGKALHILIRHDPVMAPFVRRSCETLSVIFQSYIESAGASAQPLIWRFPYAEPDNHELYGRWLHGGCYFDADALRLEVPGSIGMVPSAFRDDAAYRSTMAQCEALLMEMSEDTLDGKVRGILASHIERRVMESVPVTQIPTAHEIAAQLHVSRRTLIRRLKESGTAFQSIRDDLLKAHIQSLLARPELSLRDVAYRLGYSDGANFTRACNRMFGESPRALRRRMT